MKGKEKRQNGKWEMGNGGSLSSSVCMRRSDKLCTLALPPILVFIVTIRLDNVFFFFFFTPE